ncbi:hypothetical protein LFM09_04410 [Lentzea alba]|uniref:hypothetical protein n=1 Tax=Lentzea alba TaxID=2714351 RepID=UPI0039BFE70B
MASINIRNAAVAIGIALAAVGTTTVAAHAAEETAFCVKDGHTLNAKAHYVNSGAYHVWTSMSYRVSGGQLGPQSDVFWTIKAGGEDAYSGGDTEVPPNVWKNTPNTKQVRTYGGYEEYVVFRAVFDEPFQFDPECYASTRKI